jgi:hypothetical protein
MEKEKIEKVLFKEVDSAELHSACRFIGKTETSLNTAKIPGAEMSWIKGEGLIVRYKKNEIFIPAANVKSVYFKKES